MMKRLSERDILKTFKIQVVAKGIVGFVKDLSRAYKLNCAAPGIS